MLRLGLVLLAVVVAIAIALLAADMQRERRMREARPGGSEWWCAAGMDICFRSFAECERPLATTQVDCIPQPRAACYSLRIIIKDAVDDSCFPTVTACERYRANNLKDPEFDGITECRAQAPEDAADRARLILYGKIAGIVALAILLTVFIARALWRWWIRPY